MHNTTLKYYAADATHAVRRIKKKSYHVCIILSIKYLRDTFANRCQCTIDYSLFYSMSRIPENNVRQNEVKQEVVTCIIANYYY